jgi:archaellum component FlaF (FlaF/FlaG flagellin family)
MKNQTKILGNLVLVTVFFSSLAVPKISYAAAHPAGTNIVIQSTVYMITDDGQKRPYTSAGAFLSYGFNSWANVQPASVEDLALPQGNFIPPRDGKIVCSDRGDDKGTCYLITNGKRAAFVSAKVFNDLGFSFAKTLTGDVSFLEKDSDISDPSMQHRAGVLINKTGTVYLVTSAGLLGIPSADVLYTWGYSFGDVVAANFADTAIAQNSVMVARQGSQLSPSIALSEPENISEDSILQAYLQSSPELPTNIINDPVSVAKILDLVKVLDAIPNASFSDSYPYLTSQSLEFINKLPTLKDAINSRSAFLPLTQKISSKVDIFEGSNVALYTEVTKQQIISGAFGYTETHNLIFRKENGIWKLDFVATTKQSIKLLSVKNPTNSSVIGNGNSDIEVEMEVTDSPMVKDSSTYVLLKVTNNGSTTIEKFNYAVRVNSVYIDSGTKDYELKPGEYVVLAVPLDYYWELNNVNKEPGQYKFETSVGLASSVNELNYSNNEASLSATLIKNSLQSLQ